MPIQVAIIEDDEEIRANLSHRIGASSSCRLLRSYPDAEASGYLLKRTTPAKLLSAIREARDGGSPMTPQIARRVVQHFYHASQPDAGCPRLTARETDVLNQLAQGFR